MANSSCINLLQEYDLSIRKADSNLIVWLISCLLIIIMSDLYVVTLLLCELIVPSMQLSAYPATSHLHVCAHLLKCDCVKLELFL